MKGEGMTDRLAAAIRASIGTQSRLMADIEHWVEHQCKSGAYDGKTQQSLRTAITVEKRLLAGVEILLDTPRLATAPATGWAAKFLWDGHGDIMNTVRDMPDGRRACPPTVTTCDMRVSEHVVDEEIVCVCGCRHFAVARGDDVLVRCAECGAEAVAYAS